MPVVSSVTILTMANGAVNALSIGDGLVGELHGALRTAMWDPECTAIVLGGSGRCFSGGGDISAHGSRHRQSE